MCGGWVGIQDPAPHPPPPPTDTGGGEVVFFRHSGRRGETRSLEKNLNCIYTIVLYGDLVWLIAGESGERRKIPNPEIVRNTTYISPRLSCFFVHTALSEYLAVGHMANQTPPGLELIIILGRRRKKLK